MEEKNILTAPTAKQHAQNLSWWNALSEPWKRAYNEVMLRRSVTDVPDDQTLHNITQAVVMRFAGPKAPYPNMTFEQIGRAHV